MRVLVLIAALGCLGTACFSSHDDCGWFVDNCEDDFGGSSPARPTGSSGSGSSGSPSTSPEADNPDPGNGYANTIDQACDLHTETAVAVSDLYQATEDSVHELITCGGAQVRLARSMMAVILFSNEDLFDEEARAQLESIAEALGLPLSVPFQHDADGSWTMAFSPGTESLFTVRFYAPGEAEPILEDPFRIDSYLAKVEVGSAYSLDDLLADPSLRNTFVFVFDGVGPLAGLLNDGEPLESPFFVFLSIGDLVSLLFPGLADASPPDFGPFDSLADVELDSSVLLADPRGAVDVEYRAAGHRTTVGDLASTAALVFDLEGIRSDDGRLELTGRTDDLRYAGFGALAGYIDYTVPVGQQIVAVTSNFWDGRAYPDTRWDCGDDPDAAWVLRDDPLTLSDPAPPPTVEAVIAMWRDLRSGD